MVTKVSVSTITEDTVVGMVVTVGGGAVDDDSYEGSHSQDAGSHGDSVVSNGGSRGNHNDPCSHSW